MPGLHQCAYCGYRFETHEDLEQHVNDGQGCPEMIAGEYDEMVMISAPVVLGMVPAPGSVKMPCKDCGKDCWISPMGVARLKLYKGKAQCFFCAGPVPDLRPPDPEVAAQLAKDGYSAEDIIEAGKLLGANWAKGL